MKIPDANAAVNKEWKKTRDDPSVASGEKIKREKEVILEAQRDKKESPLCYTDGHMPPQKTRSQNQNYKSTKADSCSVVTFVKDDSGAYAVFTEQGSSASQMTAEKSNGCHARLPYCDGQAADAVSAYTQVKMEDAPRLLKILKSVCPDVRDASSTTQMAEIWANIEDPVVLL